MRNTIKKVMMVVPVLITSCQVLEKLNSGPVSSQMIMTTRAMINAGVLPALLVTADESFSKGCNLVASVFIVYFF